MPQIVRRDKRLYNYVLWLVVDILAVGALNSIMVQPFGISIGCHYYGKVLACAADYSRIDDEYLTLGCPR